MLRSGSAILIALLSFSALAGVSMEEKRSRVRFLEKISKTLPAINLEAYHRELRYEELNLSLEERAERETHLMNEQMKKQILQSYENALADTESSDEAKDRVREAILQDLELAEPGVRDALREFSLRTLDEVVEGVISSDAPTGHLERYLLEEVTDRSNFLNLHAIDGNNASSPIANGDRDSDRRSYRNKSEILESLVSDRASTRWVSGASINTNSAVTRKREANISYSLKISFLGADVSGGPKISFSRSYESKVVILSEGLNPAVTPNGDFDFHRRDRAGQIISSGGNAQKRYISFYCELGLEFETDYSGGGSFSIAGVGAGASASSRYKNEVTMSSRRILVPEYIGNQSVTMPILQRLCMNDFLGAKVNNRLTVKDSLNIQMRNIVSSLRFSHPKTKCVRDNQCIRWFNSGMRGVVGNAAVPRCVEERREKFLACEVRSVINQKCPVVKSGKLVSTGQFEYACDRGLYCKTVQDEGWLTNGRLYQYAVGRCARR